MGVSIEVVVGKARRPVNISYNTAPKAKMSVRQSVSRPASCSGAMYPRVPGALTPEPAVFVPVASVESGMSG